MSEISPQDQWRAQRELPSATAEYTRAREVFAAHYNYIQGLVTPVSALLGVCEAALRSHTGDKLLGLLLQMESGFAGFRHDAEALAQEHSRCAHYARRYHGMALMAQGRSADGTISAVLANTEMSQQFPLRDLSRTIKRMIMVGRQLSQDPRLQAYSGRADLGRVLSCMCDWDPTVIPPESYVPRNSATTK